MAKGIIEPFEILTLNNVELYASKINALLARSTPRDLYDVNAMIENNVIKDTELLKKCLVFYNMVSGGQDIDTLTFDNIKNINFMKFKTQLKSVISKTDKFDFEQAKLKVINYLKKLIDLNPQEKSFINEFRNKNDKPELLFVDNNMVENILHHPMVLWRCKK